MTTLAPPPSPSPSGARRVLGGGLRVAVDLTLVLALLAFAALAVGPRVLGYRTVTMLTGSMSPAIRPGDLVVVTPVPVTGLRVGDVVTIQAPTADRRVVTHRVTAVERAADGTTAIRTRGDANAGPDPWLATVQDDTVWVVRGTVPGAGTVIRALRVPAVRVLLTGVLPVVLLGWLLLTIWRRPSARSPR